MATVLITGANSYVASHVVKLALDKGYQVRGTVRTKSSGDKLIAAFPEHSTKLSYSLVSDITKPDLYATCLDGVDGVIHVASPFTFQPKDLAQDMLEPAKAGSLAILEAVQKYGPSVRRVINVSSFAAVVNLSKGLRPGYTYSEKDWNPTTWDEAANSDAVVAYCASKAIAERAMFDWVESNKTSINFSLTSVCPPWVFGPYATPPDDLNHISESLKFLWNLVGAKSVPDTDFAGFVDVRDLAQAIFKAYENPDAAGQRFLLGSKFSYQIAADVIRKEFPELSDKVPVGSPGSGEKEDTYSLDTTKVRKTLGLEFTPVNITVKDTMAQLLEAAK